MNSKAKPLTIKILEKEYRVACQADEEDELLASARYLDKRMREIRSTGKIVGIDRIAVMAALNMAHDLLSQEQRESANSAEGRIKSLRDRIEVALNESNQLEL